MTREKKPRLTKEEVDARFTTWQAANRARRETKVTPEDIERRLVERRQSRVVKSRNAAPGQRARTLSLGLGIALLVGSGVLATTTSTGTKTFDSITQINEQQIASLTGELRAIPTADEKSAANYSTELEQQIADATTKGEKVASLQQEFSEILFSGSTQVSGNGAPSTSFRASAEHRKSLAPYFVERAFLVSDAAAYAPGSVLPFGDGAIDPRFPWYIKYDKSGQVEDPSGSGWQLVSVVTTGTSGVLDVTWLNKNYETGDLLAWAMASFYTEPGAFGNVTVGKTTYGERAAVPSIKAGA